MLLVFAAIITVFWLIGLVAQLDGGFMNFLLATAIVFVIAHILGRRTHTI
jgi:hypothetical protein